MIKGTKLSNLPDPMERYTDNRGKPTSVNPRAELVYDYIRRNPGSRIAQIRLALGMSEGQVRQLIDSCETHGLLLYEEVIQRVSKREALYYAFEGGRHDEVYA
jgi:hypothetical protein